MLRKVSPPACLLLAFLLTACNQAGVAAGHYRINPDPRLPLTTPWDLASLSQPPAFEWLDTTSPVRSLKFRGLEYQGKPTSVFAYYATPGTLKGGGYEHNLPAVVLIHGGGGTAFREWVELWAKRGYAAIAMDLAGHRPNEGQNPHDRKNRTPLPDGGPAQDDWENKFGNIDQPHSEHWPYHAVANSILAHSLIRSFPEINPNRTAVTGISWGGYLTCIVASLDNRFRAAVPVYGCGFLHENSAWLPIFARMTPEQREKWVNLYDPSRYLPACRVPIFFVNGTNDFAYPLDSYMKSYHAVPMGTPKNIRVTVNMPHSHPAGWEPKEIGLWVDNPWIAPHVWIPPYRSNPTHALVAYDVFNNAIASAALHFTTNSAEGINNRAWTSRPITLDPATVTTTRTGTSWATQEIKLTFEGPPADATAWFVTVTDQHGSTISSEVAVIK